MKTLLFLCQLLFWSSAFATNIIKIECQVLVDDKIIKTYSIQTEVGQDFYLNSNSEKNSMKIEGTVDEVGGDYSLHSRILMKNPDLLGSDIPLSSQIHLSFKKGETGEEFLIHKNFKIHFIIK